MAKNIVTVTLKNKTSESEITFTSTRQLFGWIVRNPKAKLGVDKAGNWLIKM